MRKRDLHILTAGVLTYTSDQRFQVIHPDNSDNWTLLIKFAQPRDAGIYECQVNTEPKMSLAFQLNVVGSGRAAWCAAAQTREVKEYLCFPPVRSSKLYMLINNKIFVRYSIFKR
ncbi:hypothetical protein QTP88_016452 [Uroleucon formosanum]